MTELKIPSRNLLKISSAPPQYISHFDPVFVAPDQWLWNFSSEFDDDSILERASRFVSSSVLLVI